MREGAVVATVAAQLRQRNEHLARIRHERAVAVVAQRARPPSSAHRDRRSRAAPVRVVARRRLAGDGRARSRRASSCGHLLRLRAHRRARPHRSSSARGPRVAMASPGTAPDPPACRCRARCAAAARRAARCRAPGGGEMRKEAVVAEAQRHRIGRRAQHRVGAHVVARRRDREAGRRACAVEKPRGSRPASPAECRPAPSSGRRRCDSEPVRRAP